jgi:hypothetical protein
MPSPNGKEKSIVIGYLPVCVTLELIDTHQDATAIAHSWLDS